MSTAAGKRGFGRFVLTRERRRKEPRAGGGWTWQPDGSERVTCELWINVDGLAELLGRRAAQNVGTNRATLAAGLIEARVVERERV